MAFMTRLMGGDASDITLDKTYEDKNEAQVLELLKKRVTEWETYWEDNTTYYKRVRRSIYGDMYTAKDQQHENQQGVPKLKFNILEKYIAKQRGEFHKASPGLTVVKSPDGAPVADDDADLMEGAVRHLFDRMDKENVKGELFGQTVSGGYGVAHIYTDYINDYSMNQDIKIEYKGDPTKCGFDINAKMIHKGDGDMCYEYRAITKAEFKKRWPNRTEPTPMGAEGGIRWAFDVGTDRFITICDFYYKRKISQTLLYLSNNQSVLEKDLPKFIKDFKAANPLQVVPKEVSRRKTNISEVDRYTFSGDEILEYVKTDYSYLPLIYFDGDSKLLDQDDQGSVRQVIRSCIHNALDAQQFKDVVGRVLAAKISNFDDLDWMIAEEAKPTSDEDRRTLKNPQGKRVGYYRSLFQLPDQTYMQLPVPQRVTRFPMPPELPQLFQGADNMIQNIMGAFDTNMAQNNNELSGKGIIEAAMQSNATNMPYIINFLPSLAQLGTIAIDLMTKYHIYPRQIPVLDKEGRQKSVQINENGKRTFNFHPSTLSISLKAGMNFQAQQEKGLQMLMLLSESFPEIESIVNSPPGTVVLFENLSFHGSDRLKTIAQQRADQPPAPQPPPPQVLEQQNKTQELQLKAQDQAHRQQIDLREITLKEGEQALDHARLNLDRQKAAHESQSQSIKDAALIHNSNTKATESHAKILLGDKEIDSREKIEAMKAHAAQVDSMNELARDIMANAAAKGEVKVLGED